MQRIPPHSFHPILSAIALFLAASVLCASVVGIVYVDLRYLGQLHTQSEASLLEIIQTVLVGSISIAFFAAAARRPHLRGGLVLAGGFFLCMFIRENDNWLDAICHGFWYPVALAATAVCLCVAWRFRATIKDGLSALSDPRTPLLSAVAFALLLVFSRLFGTKVLWRAAGLYQVSRAIKTVAEESLELLAYSFLALWTFLTLRLLPPRSN